MKSPTSRDDPSDSNPSISVTEAEVKRLEAEVKKLDLERQRGRSPWLTSPLTALVVTGGLGLCTALTTNFIQGANTIELEREKLSSSMKTSREQLKSSLILKVIDTGDAKASARNLLFLLDAGLIDDPTGSIERLRSNPENAPVLGGPRDTIVPETPAAVEAFLKMYLEEFPGANPKKIENLQALVRFIVEDQTVQDRRVTAYMLATIQWETATTFGAMSEYGSDAQLEKRYGLGSLLGSSLGNTQPGDGARFRGRGYIMLTGRSNYARIGKALGLDLLDEPDLLLDPATAYRVLSFALSNGLFTGKKISQYINSDGADYRNARRVINGLDKADEIAARAVIFEEILRMSIPQQN